LFQASEPVLGRRRWTFRPESAADFGAAGANIDVGDAQSLRPVRRKISPSRMSPVKIALDRPWGTSCGSDRLVESVVADHVEEGEGFFLHDWGIL